MDSNERLLVLTEQTALSEITSLYQAYQTIKFTDSFHSNTKPVIIYAVEQK
jgi:hypothetical protein